MGIGRVFNRVHMDLRTYTDFDACVAARDAGLGRISAFLFCFLDDESVYSL